MLPGYGGRAFNGINLKVTKLPGDFNINLLYGKTDNNGGFNSYQRSNTPTELVAGRIVRNFNGHMYGINTFHNLVYNQSVNSPRSGYDINTMDFKFVWGDFSTFGELGFGSYGSPTYARKTSEAINVHVSTKSGLTGLPFDFHFFRLGPNFINLNGGFFTTTIPEAQQANNTVLANQSFNLSDNPLPLAGMMNNNMMGTTISTQVDIDKIKIDFSYSISQELSRISNKITYAHRISGLAFSRFNNGSRGPYNRITTFFNGFYSTLSITDPQGDSKNKLSYNKQYNSLEGRLRYKTNFNKRDFFFFVNSSVQSVAAQQLYIVSKRKNPLLYLWHLEGEAFYNILPKLTISTYAGFERARANEQTDLNTYNLDDVKTPPTKLPSDQIGKSLAFGLDYAISGSTGLYLRHRFFSYSDLNFQDERFKGNETTIELKAVFW
jgi:hypothetical protein